MPQMYGNKPMRRIYFECFLGLVLHLCLIVGGYNFIVYDLNVDYDYLLEDFEGEGLRSLVGEIYRHQGEEAALTAVNNYAKTTRQILTKPNTLPEDIQQFFFHTAPQSHTYHDADRVLWFRFKLDDDIYSLRPDMNTPLRRSIEFDNDILWVFFIVGFALYSILFTWFLSRRVRSLEKATFAFANGNFDMRVSEKSADKVGALNRSFNYMADKISSLIYTNKALTNAVAHELRTPIFRIQWQAELLQEGNLLPEQKKRVTSIIEDIDEMDAMVNELLYYAKVERADIKLKVVNVAIEEWLSNIITKWNSHNQSNIYVIDSTPNGYLDCDPYILTQAINNLIGNANKYCRSSIYLSYQVKNGYWNITVEDDGDGIPEEHWPFIFDAFYSANSSRNKENEGFGLGLAIVKQIIKLHDGRIEISNSVFGGAKFTLFLPVEKAVRVH